MLNNTCKEQNKKTIVFARNISFENPIQTNTHNYAIQFQRAGWNTIWIPKPLTPWNVSGTPKITPVKDGVNQYQFFFLFNYGGKRINTCKIFWNLFPYFKISPSKKFMQSKGLFRPDVFFSGSLESASLNKILKPRFFIYNAHDAFSLYPGVQGSILKIERETVYNANLIVTTSEMTRELLITQYGKPSVNVINLGHGADNSRYLNVTEPARIHFLPRPRIVCLGTLDMQDIQLTIDIMKALEKIPFVFIGPGGDYLKSSISEAGITNAFFLGAVDQKEVPDYLSFCDVGIICYDKQLKENRLYGTNPMKRYDYAAAGLQTVSINLLEYDKNPSPMYIADTSVDFVNSIIEAIHKPKFTKTEIKQFASANDWRSKYEKLLSYID